MEERPRKELIDEAKAFILRRVDAETSASGNVERYMLAAAEEIVGISLRYGISPALFRFSANKSLKAEVDKVIERLKAEIEDAVYDLAAAVDEDGRDSIIAVVDAETYGRTFKERLDTYTGRYEMELEGAIAAGLSLGKGAKAITESIKGNLSAPYNNPDMKAAYGHGLVARRVKGKGISYGAGRSNSARNLITTLARDRVSAAWMDWYVRDAEKRGLTGYWSFRGSSYPCATCDDETGYHPISDFRGHYHPRCRCYFVFV